MLQYIKLCAKEFIHMPAYKNEIVKMKFSAASILKFKCQIQLKRQDSIYLYLK